MPTASYGIHPMPLLPLLILSAEEFKPVMRVGAFPGGA